MAPISLCPAKTFRRRGSRVTRKCDHYCDQEFAATRKLFAFTRRLHDVTDRRCWRGSEIFRLKPSYLLQAWRHRMLEFWFSEHISQNLCLIFCGPQIAYSVPRTILSFFNWLIPILKLTKVVNTDKYRASDFFWRPMWCEVKNTLWLLIGKATWPVLSIFFFDVFMEYIIL